MKHLTPILLTLALIAGLPFAVAAEKGAQPRRVAFGQKVDLAALAVPGKTTVFDFTSQFCPPCRAIAPKLDELHASRDDIVVVAIDINRPDVKGIDWKSPVAQQYGIHSIPQFKIYGPDGKLRAEGDEAETIVLGWIGE